MKTLISVKKIKIFITAAIILSASALSATVYLDVSATTAKYGDEGVLNGAGLTIGWDILDRYDFMGKTDAVIISQYAYRVDKTGEPLEETHTAVPLLAGVRYSYELFGMPLFATGTAAAGAIFLYSEGPKKIGAFYDPSQTVTLWDVGWGFTIRPGIVWLATQRVSLFLEGGFNFVNCSYDFGDSKLSGFQALAGVRFTFTGANRGLW